MFSSEPQMDPMGTAETCNDGQKLEIPEDTGADTPHTGRWTTET